MTLYQLTPIENTEGLPDGWYITTNGSIISDAAFYKSGFGWLDIKPNQNNYLRLIPESQLREEAGRVWDAAVEYEHHAHINHQYRLTITAPDRDTFINEYIKTV